jgi:Icc-related predicted phosphoesterase
LLVVRVAAVADIHSPKYLEIFRRGLAELGECDLFLLAGDLVLKSDHTQLATVVAAICEFYRGKILACFGNEEYQRDEEKFKDSPELEWLDDQSTTVEVRGLKVGIVGSRGSLDRPTFWQRTHLKGIAQVYRERVKVIDRLLSELRADVKLVMTHYAPTYATLEGEQERAWPEMACRAFESVIRRQQPDVWIHGHAHQSKCLAKEFGRTLVLNASLPARGGVATLELPRKTGLDRFFNL